MVQRGGQSLRFGNLKEIISRGCNDSMKEPTSLPHAQVMACRYQSKDGRAIRALYSPVLNIEMGEGKKIGLKEQFDELGCENTF